MDILDKKLVREEEKKMIQKENYLQQEKLQVHQYILKNVQNTYSMLFEVHMDSWIVDLLDIVDEYQQYFETSMYYGRFIEIMEEDIVHPDESILVGELFSMSRIMHEITEKKEPYEFRLRCRFGEEYRWFLFQFSYMPMKEGAGRLVVLQKDINRAVLKEKVQKRQQSVINMLSERYDFVALVNLRNKTFELIRNTPAMAKYLHHTNYEHVLKDYMEVKLEGEEADKVYALLRRDNLYQHFNDKKNCIEYIFQEKSGDYIKLYVMATSYYSKEAPDIIACFENITESMKDRERQFASHIKAQNEILKKALQEAKEASHAKSEFLSNMSHDIRTPMNAIMGLTNVALKNYRKPEKVQKCLENIMQSSRHMMNIVNNVLDMSQITSGELELHLEEYRMSSMLHEIERTMQKLCQEKAQQLHFEQIGIVHDMVKMDVVRMRQVLMNVAMNAIEFTPEGGHIAFEVMEQRQKGLGFRNAQFLFTISDTGIGISETFQKQIFQPFEQEMNTLSDRNEGAGLGLTITKYILDKMGGTIGIESELGHGTVVTIGVKLPLGRNPEKEATELEEVPVKTYPGKRILIVEDKKMNIEIIRELLNGSETILEEAHDGQEAIEMITNMPQNYYDLIFMDIRMPVLKGDEATMKIRNMRRQDCQKIPIIAMTANVLEEDMKRAIRVGMDGYLTKPVELESMFNVLDKYLL